MINKVKIHSSWIVCRWWWAMGTISWALRRLRSCWKRSTNSIHNSLELSDWTDSLESQCHRIRHQTPKNSCLIILHSLSSGWSPTQHFHVLSHPAGRLGWRWQTRLHRVYTDDALGLGGLAHSIQNVKTWRTKIQHSSDNDFDEFLPKDLDSNLEGQEKWYFMSFPSVQSEKKINQAGS